MGRLPKESKALAIATKRGVEIAPDGKAYGLVRLFHGCGNDPVRYDLRRIDLAQMLAFQQEGESDLKPVRYADKKYGRLGGMERHEWTQINFILMTMSFDPKRPLPPES